MDQVTVPSTPEETMRHVIDFFEKFDLDAIGIGSFGPIDIDIESTTYGNITSTPKSGWNEFQFVQTMKNKFNVSIGFNTEVNGAAKGLDCCICIYYSRDRYWLRRSGKWETTTKA